MGMFDRFCIVGNTADAFVAQLGLRGASIVAVAVIKLFKFWKSMVVMFCGSCFYALTRRYLSVSRAWF